MNMNPRVLLRSSRHPSSATTALPSQTLIHRLLHSPGSGVGTSPSAQFQNSFLFASGREKAGKRGFSSTARKRTWEKKDAEGSEEKSGDASTGGKIKAPELQEKEVKSITPEKLRTRLEKECSKTAPSPLIRGAKTRGKLLPTPFRTLKLLLPLTGPLAGSLTSSNEYLVILVHPQQPLFTLSQLIQAELPPLASSPPLAPRVIFKATDCGAEGGSVRWSSSTLIEDFVRDAARTREFTIELEDAGDVTVSVPSFKERSYFLREKLRETTGEIDTMVKLREGCDAAVQRSARKAAAGGLFGILGWWAGVYWLTFQTAYGWGVISPVAYLAGLVTVISSYLFFLHSNSNFSHRARRQRLYENCGFDQERWWELVGVGKTLRAEILAIAEQYDETWDEGKDEVGGERMRRLLRGKVTGLR